MRNAAPVVAVLAILAIAGAIVAAAIAGADQVELAPFLFAAVAAPAGIGALVAWRRPGERVAWILLLGALSVGVVMCADQVSALLLDRDRTSTAGRWIPGALAGEWPVLFLWPLALAYLFPDGRLPGPRWRIPWRITLAAAVGVLGLLPFAKHLSEPFDDVLSPVPVSFEGSFGGGPSSGSAGPGCSAGCSRRGRRVVAEAPTSISVSAVCRCFG